MCFLTVRIIAVIFVVHKVINEEIDRRVYARHKSNIEIAHQRERQENCKDLIVTFFDKLFDSVSDDRQPYNCIYPHRVVLLNNAVCG